MRQASPAAVLSRFPTVLLDFDGPICSIFSGITSAEVAEALRQSLGLKYAAPDSTDPFDVLRVAAKDGLSDAAQAERALAELETAAVASAEPTPGAFELIDELAGAGRRLAVVSNNSAEAVRAFLDRHQLQKLVTAVSARDDPEPGLLKPHPYLISRACTLTKSPAHKCVLIGDSLSDLQAARRIAVAFIGYANKPGKREAFEEHKPGAVIDDMRELLADGRTLFSN